MTLVEAQRRWDQRAGGQADPSMGSANGEGGATEGKARRNIKGRGKLEGGKRAEEERGSGGKKVVGEEREGWREGGRGREGEGGREG